MKEQIETLQILYNFLKKEVQSDIENGLTDLDLEQFEIGYKLNTKNQSFEITIVKVPEDEVQAIIESKNENNTDTLSQIGMLINNTLISLNNMLQTHNAKTMLLPLQINKPEGRKAFIAYESDTNTINFMPLPTNFECKKELQNGHN